MSTYADKTLNCVECKTDFTYAATEQELHASLGYQNEPKRCMPCREAKRQRKGDSRRGGGGGGEGGLRESFTANCAECGKEAQLPFKPRADRTVYCSDCFSNKQSAI